MSAPSWLAALREALPPSTELLSGPAEGLAYDADAFTIARRRPQATVLPADFEGLAAAVRFAARHRLQVVPRGAGTGLSGGALAPEGEGFLLGTSRMRRLLHLDPQARWAHAEAGLVNGALDAAAAAHGLAFAPDPSSAFACTLGGNVAENAGGPHTLKQGVTAHHVLGLRALLADGTELRLGGPEGPGPGPDLTGLIVGSEGTLALVGEVWVRLVPRPKAVATLLGIFPDVASASRAVGDLIAQGVVPAALELLDAAILEAVEAAFHLGFPPEAGAVLIAEVDGEPEAVAEEARRVEACLRAHGASELRRAQSAPERAQLWLARKKAVGAVGRLAPSKITMDGVVPRGQLPHLLAQIQAIATEHGLRAANVFHAGDGNLHPILLFDEKDPDQVRRVLKAGGAILDACLAVGGSITGEHGVGIEKLGHMARQFGPETLAAFARLKAAFDPEARFNPGKLLPDAKGCAACLEGPPRVRGVAW